MPIRAPPKGTIDENIPGGKGMIRRNGLRAVALSHKCAEGYRNILQYAILRRLFRSPLFFDGGELL